MSTPALPPRQAGVPDQGRTITVLRSDLKRIAGLANPHKRALRAHTLVAEANAVADACLDSRNEAIAILYWRDGWLTTDLERLAHVEAPWLQKIRNKHRPAGPTDDYIDKLAEVHPDPADEAAVFGKLILERRELAREARAVRDGAIREILAGAAAGPGARGSVAALARYLSASGTPISSVRVSQILAADDDTAAA